MTEPYAPTGSAQLHDGNFHADAPTELPQRGVERVEHDLVIRRLEPEAERLVEVVDEPETATEIVRLNVGLQGVDDVDELGEVLLFWIVDVLEIALPLLS